MNKQQTDAPIIATPVDEGYQQIGVCDVCKKPTFKFLRHWCERKHDPAEVLVNIFESLCARYAVTTADHDAVLGAIEAVVDRRQPAGRADVCRYCGRLDKDCKCE